MAVPIVKLDISENVKIDIMNLEEECAVQADLYLQHSEILVEAQKRADTAKANVSKVSNQVALNYRSGKFPVPKDTGGNPIKVTDRVIESLIETNDDVQKAHAEYIEATGAYLRAKQNVEAMQQRRSMLNNIVQMAISGYSQVIGKSYKGVAESTDEVREGINQE